MKTLENAIQVQAQIIAGRLGMDVTFGGDTAYCDGKRINIPLIQITDSMAEKFIEQVGQNVTVVENNGVFHYTGTQLKLPNTVSNSLNEIKRFLTEVVWGYLYHEAFHGRFTDFGIVKQIQNMAEKQLSNVVEDIWIEGKGPGDFLTAKSALDALNHYLSMLGGYRVSDQSTPANILEMHVLMRGLAVRNNTRSLMHDARIAAKAFEETFPEGAVTRVNGLLLTELPKLSGSDGNLELSRKILQVMQEEKDKEQDSQPTADNDSDEQSSDEESSTDDSMSGPSNESDSRDASEPSKDKGDQDTGDNQGDAQNSDSDDSSDANQTGSAEQNQGDADKRAACEAVLNADDGDFSHEERQQLLQSLVEDAAHAAAGETTPFAPIYIHGMADNGLLNENRLHSDNARRELARLIEDEVRSKRSVRNEGRRLSGRHLHRVRTLNPNVFLDHSVQRQKRCAVHLLLDTSSSMHSQIKQAVDSCISLGMAFESLSGASLSISHFPSYDASRNAGVGVLLDRGERLGAVSSRFRLDTAGCTPLAEAMWYAGYELLQCNEERKLVMVVTDGEPDCVNSVLDVVERMTNSGIETFGIGISSHSVERIFPKYEVISHASELGACLRRMTQSYLAA